MEFYTEQGQTIWPTTNSSGLGGEIIGYISCAQENVDEFSGIFPKEHWIYRTKKEFDEEQKCLHS